MAYHLIPYPEPPRPFPVCHDSPGGLIRVKVNMDTIRAQRATPTGATASEFFIRSYSTGTRPLILRFSL